MVKSCYPVIPGSSGYFLVHGAVTYQMATGPAEERQEDVWY